MSVSCDPDDSYKITLNHDPARQIQKTIIHPGFPAMLFIITDVGIFTNDFIYANISQVFLSVSLYHS